MKLVNVASVGALVLSSALLFKAYRDVKKCNNKTRIREGKIVIITGCDSGLGRLAALHLAHHQYTVIACFLNPNCASAIQLKELYPARVRIVGLDLLKTEDIEKFNVFLTNQLQANTVWALVNNAARTNYLSPVHLTADQLMVKEMKVNFFGPMRMFKAVFPYMQPGSRVVNISSLTARLHFKHLSMYSASKAALEALSDCLRLELKEKKIFVSVLRLAGFFTDSCGEDVLEVKCQEVIHDLHSELSTSKTSPNHDLVVADKNDITNIYTAFKSTMVKYCSKDTSIFTNTLLRCIDSPQPSPYYYVGRSSLVLSLLSHIMPYCFLDWLCS